MVDMLYENELIFDDVVSDAQYKVLTELGRGYKGMFRGPASVDELTVPFPSELEIPESDWQPMIEEMVEQKSRVSDLIKQKGWQCKFQDRTNFCWAFAPVAALEIARCLANEDFVSLSPASVACLINNFQNQGGWGEDALRQLIKVGAVPSADWPDTAIDPRYNTKKNLQKAASYRPLGWYNLRPRNTKQFISCLLRRIPVAIGLSWWEHEVLALDPVWYNGVIAVRFVNSWGLHWPQAGAGGYSILQGQKMLPDDAVAIRYALAG